MLRHRKRYVALAWIYPPVFVGVTVSVLDSLPESEATVCALLLLGPLAFTGLLSCLLFNRHEERHVRYARASRRLGRMCKFAALGVLAAFFSAIHYRMTHDLLFVHLAGLTLFVFFAMIGLMLSAVAFRMLKLNSPEDGGARDAFIVTAVMVTAALFFLPELTRSPTPKWRPCQKHIEGLGMLCEMFAYDHDGLYPELSSKPGYLSMAYMSDRYSRPVVPEYVTDVSILICPMSAQWEQRTDPVAIGQEAFDSSSYVYLGYVVKSSKELETFFDCYKKRVAGGLPFDEDLPAPPGRGTGGSDKLLRLRNGAEGVYLNKSAYMDDPLAHEDVMARIPVLIERPGNHERPRGINVLYMNRRVKFLKYPGKWPATPETFSTIEAIERMRPPENPPNTPKETFE